MQTGIVTTRTSDHNYVNMILASSFVPTADVINAFEMLVESRPREVEPVIDYWKGTYIGRQRRARRAPPLLAIEIWNVRGRFTDGLPRTNNSVEAWHRSFQQTVRLSSTDQQIVIIRLFTN